MTTLIRSTRLHAGLRPADVARAVGVHPMTVLRWERRDRLPGPQHIGALAAVLGLERGEVAGFFDEARQARPADPRPPADLSCQGPPDDRSAGCVGATGPLRRMRQRTRLSGTRAAALAGVDRKRLGAWERGLATPPLSALRRLAAAYGVGVGEVARAAGVVPPPQLDRRTWHPGDLPGVLRTLRDWAGLTQADLALRCGCSRDAVRSWEAGRAQPTPASLRALERALGLPAGDLDRAARRQVGRVQE